MSKKIAIFPGSFDPFTIGHESVITRAMPLFDEIIVAIGTNTNKQAYFSMEQRMQMIREVFSDNEQVKVESYKGLTVEFCRQKGARYLLRGLRTAADFEYERAIAQTNKAMYEILLTRLKEIDLSRSLNMNNIAVVDPATLPEKPIKAPPPIKLRLCDRVR